jgi:hypothetical protein
VVVAGSSHGHDQRIAARQNLERFFSSESVVAGADLTVLPFRHSDEFDASERRIHCNDLRVAL